MIKWNESSIIKYLNLLQWFLEKPHVATFMGCVGKDKYSKILEEKARSSGLNVKYQYNDTTPTGTCAVLITGKSRSLCANLAAANCFSISHIHEPENQCLLESAQYYYISVSFQLINYYNCNDYFSAQFNFFIVYKFYFRDFS